MFNYTGIYFSDVMAEKKTAKTVRKKAKNTKTGAKAKRRKKPAGGSLADSGIIIVDDSFEIDQEKINEERRAYLEEARSQEASD